MRSTSRPTTRSCGSRGSPVRWSLPIRAPSSFTIFPSAAITTGRRWRWAAMEPCSLTTGQQPIPASRPTGRAGRRERCRAESSTCAPASGATMPTDAISPRRSASGGPPACATRKPSRSIHPPACSGRRSMAAINWARAGDSATKTTPKSRPRNSGRCRRAPTTAGRIATTIPSRTRRWRHPSTAVTASSRAIAAARRSRRSRFPGHWAPLQLAFVPRRSALGAAYEGGAFLAFHGSWNRAPLPQAGYRVVFIPFRNGEPVGSYTTFATGVGAPTALRASGVAVAPDGSALYIGSDQAGKIWRVTRSSGR